MSFKSTNSGGVGSGKANFRSIGTQTSNSNTAALIGAQQQPPVVSLAQLAQDPSVPYRYRWKYIQKLQGRISPLTKDLNREILPSWSDLEKRAITDPFSDIKPGIGAAAPRAAAPVSAPLRLPKLAQANLKVPPSLGGGKGQLRVPSAAHLKAAAAPPPAVTSPIVKIPDPDDTDSDSGEDYLHLLTCVPQGTR